MMRQIIASGWLAFLTACVMEVLVFGFVDPADVHWMGKPLALRPIGVYSIAFLAFWAVIAVGIFIAMSLRNGVDTCQSDPAAKEQSNRNENRSLS